MQEQHWIVLSLGNSIPPRRAPAGEAGTDTLEDTRRPLRVLIVEDEAITAMHIEDMVLDLGHVVVGTADTEARAIAAASAHRPDLVLMDIRLAKKSDGIAAAMEIRRQQDIPAIFMSAHSDPVTRQRAAAANPLGYLVKPVVKEQIAALFNDLFGKAG